MPPLKPKPDAARCRHSSAGAAWPASGTDVAPWSDRRRLIQGLGILLGSCMAGGAARAEARNADAPPLGRPQGTSGRDPQRGVVPASVGGMTGAQDAALRAIVRNSGRTGVAAVPPPGAIPIAAGARIQDAVDAQPPGTAFILAAGRFVGQTVSPKSGNRFYGSATSGDTILEGAGAARAFQGQGIADVLLSGLVFADWATPNESTGVLGTDGSAKGWKVENCTFRHNRIGPPVMLGAGMRVVNCHFHHNEASGIGAWKIHDAEIDHCEFNHNNQKREWPFTATGSVAGIKLAWTTNLRFTNNHIHDNINTVGFWLDINCSGSLISGNLIEDNDVGGLLIELDYGALIQDNVIRRNNLSLADGFKGGGIYIQNSSNVIVRRNFVVGNGGGIWLYESNRGQGAQGPWVTRNNQIEDNIIAFTAGRNGFGGSAQHAPTNRFQRNTYYVAGAGSFFLGMPVDIAGWQKSGFDTPAGGSIVNLRPLSPDLP